MNEFKQQYAAEYRAATRAPADCGACPPSEQLARLAEGRLWPWQRRTLTRHLAQCSACSADLQAVMQVREELAETLSVPAQNSAAGLLRPAIAGLAVAVTLGLAVSLVSPPGNNPTARPGTIASSAPQPRPGDGDLLFVSDFDGPGTDPAPLFRDDFDG